ncbi:unnamed protein product [Symbiodinium natans]|uniref:Uncharacterized protein n=1 Tax=Symbiodinium natans TaxID=878477 RepID=A0A812TP22_9DINO|nr:unnamed protein product [Symbiodinium natans]
MLAAVHQSLNHSEALSVLAGHLGSEDLQLQEELANCGVLSIRLSRKAEVWLDVDFRLRPAKSKYTLKVLVVQEPPDLKNLQLEGFDLVLTWHQDHLDLQQSRFFVPATPWLVQVEWPRFASKKPGLGFLRGSKNQTAGHQLRHRIWEARQQLQDISKVPLEFLAGGGISRDERNIQFFNQFVLVIENSRHQNYFSEKLLDTLLTQSIPIYWGCPNIGDFFDAAAWTWCSGWLDDSAEQRQYHASTRTERPCYTLKSQVLSGVNVRTKKPGKVDDRLRVSGFRGLGFTVLIGRFRVSGF